MSGEYVEAAVSFCLCSLSFFTRFYGVIWGVLVETPGSLAYVLNYHAYS